MVLAPLRRPAVIATFAYVVVALLLCSNAIFRGAALGPDAELDRHPPFGREEAAEPTIFDDITLTYLDYPRDLAIARGLQSGRLDLWNPLSACGAPLWAEQGGPFFPLKLVFYLHPTPTTYKLFLALRLVVAALGAYALARFRGQGTLAAFFSGLLFELSGIMVAQLSFATASALCMAPWVLLGAHSLARGGSRRAIAGTAVLLGITGSSGHPGVTLLILSSFVVAIGGHMIAIRGDARRTWRLITRSALAFVLGAALMAPTILPLVELRGEGRSYKHTEIGEEIWKERLEWSLEALPVALFAPSTFEDRSFAREAHWPWTVSPALSAVGLLLGVTGLLLGGLDIALAAVALFGLGLATSLPGFGWLHHVPGLALIIPWYCWVLVVLALTQTAGHAIEKLDSPAGRRAISVGGIVVLAGMGSLGLLHGESHRLAAAFAGAVSEGFVRMPLLLSVVLVLTGTGLAWLPQHMRASIRPGTVIAVVAAVHAFTLLRPLVHQPPSITLVSPPPESIKLLRAQMGGGEARIHSPSFLVAQPHSSMLFGLPDVRGLSALPIRRYARFMESIPGGESIFTLQHTVAPVAALLDLAAVGWVLEDARAPWLTRIEVDPNLSLVYRDASTVLLKNSAALPRARIVHEALMVADEDAAAALLAGLGRQSLHVGETPLAQAVVLELGSREEAPPPTAPPLSTRRSQSAEQVELLSSEDPDRIAIQVQLSTPGWLILGDTYYPGWTAEVDGAPVNLQPANLAFRAVAVPQGSHRIELSYSPMSFQLGVALFAMAGLGCLALTFSRQPTWGLRQPQC